MKTFMANASNIKKEWFIVDATDMPLGRLASQVAAILRGKNKPTFTPNVDCGDNVIIINSNNVVLTGKKLTDKYKYHYSGFQGGMKKTQFKDLMNEKSDWVVEEAVRGMLPKTRLGRKQIKHLRVYKDANHGHEAQQPKMIKLVGGIK